MSDGAGIFAVRGPSTPTRSWRAGLLAAVGGTLVAFSMPPWGWWPLAFVGVAMLELALGPSPSRRQAAARAFVFALPWMAIGMCWMWFLTIPGYLVSFTLFAGFHAAAGALAPTGPWRTIGRPAAHTLVEVVRFGFPFGGVPLASLGISQAGGPLLGLARLGGVVLITWVVFQIGFALADIVPATVRRFAGHGATTAAPVPRHALAALGSIVVLVALAGIAPEGRDLDRSPLTIAAVQGGGEQGTTALDVPSRVVTQRLLDATASIAPDPDLDVVVWPENGVDVDLEPFAGSDAARAIAREAERLGVPILVGVTLDSEYSAEPRPGSFVNAQMVVTPDGEVTSSYEKVRIVPFGEYVPLRGALEAVGAPVDQIPSDAVTGSGPAWIELPDGVRLGVMISWEVFFGGRGRAASDDGTAILLNPTNGASYTGTVLQTQQVASSRLRAVENGRWLVQVSPTGFSAFVGPDGSVHQRTDVSERAVIRMDVALRAGSTWYHSLGNAPWVLAAGMLLAWSWWSARGRTLATVHEAAATDPAGVSPGRR